MECKMTMKDVIDILKKYYGSKIDAYVFAGGHAGGSTLMINTQKLEILEQYAKNEVLYLRLHLPEHNAFIILPAEDFPEFFEDDKKAHYACERVSADAGTCDG